MLHTHLLRSLWICWPGRNGINKLMDLVEMTEKMDRRESNHRKWLTSRKIWSIEALETICGHKSTEGHYNGDRLKKRGLERDTSRRSALKGRERPWSIGPTLELFHRQPGSAAHVWVFLNAWVPPLSELVSIFVCLAWSLISVHPIPLCVHAHRFWWRIMPTSIIL